MFARYKYSSAKISKLWTQKKYGYQKSSFATNLKFREVDDTVIDMNVTIKILSEYSHFNIIKNDCRECVFAYENSELVGREMTLTKITLNRNKEKDSINLFINDTNVPLTSIRFPKCPNFSVSYIRSLAHAIPLLDI